MKTTEQKLLPIGQLMALKRNPQYLTPAQMDGLKRSINRDGFVVPILVRPLRKGAFEVISGNHRFMAAVELKLTHVPCVVAKLSDRDAKRLAVNLNTIHGEPNAELLAPFLADMDESLLGEIHLEGSVVDELLECDKQLAERLRDLEPPDRMNRDSLKNKNHVCVCPMCGRKHFKPEP